MFCRKETSSNNRRTMSSIRDHSMRYDHRTKGTDESRSKSERPYILNQQVKATETDIPV